MDEWPARALTASLDLQDRVAVKSELPPLWHWLYFLNTAGRGEMNPDGHPIDPDLADFTHSRRRMFASARVDFDQPLRLGRNASMTESIVRTQVKQGTNGPLRIVTFGYQYFQDGVCCIREERDIIYLEAQAGGENGRPPASGTVVAADSAPSASMVAKVITPDPVLLFRFSALTFNAHRIHYDRQFAQEQEGYRERVVHGPLVAILLVELLREHDPRSIRHFAFRARRPLFVNEAVHLSAQALADKTLLQASNLAGMVAMEATVQF
jgi:3-methylfumaryl-CoA hydratase